MDKSTTSHYVTLSNAGIGALAGGAGMMWVFSHVNHNAHWRETGFLAGEAALNSLAVTEALKYSMQRQRPYVDNAAGSFFQSGGTSFPSEHSAAAWSIAAVVAHEYPGPLTKILAYGLAGLVDYSRVRGQQHFPSDVFIGALIGELSAYKVYHRHHDPELGGDDWESWSAKARRAFADPLPANTGSPYVPIDSWVYPALDRLIGMNLINSAFLAARPWTRRECARLLNEANDHLAGADDGDASKIVAQLEQEFRFELQPPEGGVQVQLDSVYTRVMGISGPPLGRGYEAYDFGQTIINDYGRPYEEGINNVTGFTAYTTAGPWFGYIQAEYQHAPSAPPLTLSEREFFPTVSFNYPVYPDTPFAAVNRVQLLDAYAGLTFENWQISFGNQSMWEGPTEGGPVLMSNNAEPITMLRIARVTPIKLGPVSWILGPAWFEFFIGQLSGHDFERGPSGIVGSYAGLGRQPFIHGEKVSFHPTKNIEFGVLRTVIFSGEIVPFTAGTLKHTLLGFGDAASGTLSDPGDQRSELNWSYRLPLLRRWVSFYGDAFTDDQFSPIAYWDRSVISAGLYFSHIPKIPKLDFRVEGVYSDVPAGGAIGKGFFYSNNGYLNGYTNDGNLIGSWIGRDGQGAQAWTNYWFTPKNKLQLYYRHLKVSQQFVPGGGTITDFGLQGDVWTTPRWGFSANAQYEAWTFPIIRPGQQAVFSSSLQVTYRPDRWNKQSKIK
jgi:membrane-associated phospholipid phosphatase